jgi:hypothetical protein
VLAFDAARAPQDTEAITLIDPHNAEIYFQCIYVDAATFQIKSNVTYGLPGVPGSSLARKVHGHWPFSHVQGTSFAPPTLDVPQ